MKRVIFGLIIIILLSTITGCNLKKDSDISKNKINKKVSDVKVTDIKVIINNETYSLSLENNNTAKEFINLLPQEFNMSELNGNEKYVYINHSLTTKPYKPNQIEKGDVMLYGDNCLVIFYKSFNTSYSYTKIGHIDNLEDLGNENIIVKFENNTSEY